MDFVQEMLRPETYNEETDSVRMVQTHVSWVFLTGRHAYKVKKPVNFGFVDYSTLYKRKDFCEREIVLNRRLCDGMYEGVLPIVRSKDGLRIGGEGEPVEYTVKMTEFPQSALMSNMLKKGKVGKELVGEIAHIIADFHAKAERGRKIMRADHLLQ